MTKSVPKVICDGFSLISGGTRLSMGPDPSGEDTWLVFDDFSNPDEPLLYVGSGPLYNPSLALPDFSSLTASQQTALAKSIFDEVDCLHQHQGGVLDGIRQSLYILQSLQNAASTKKAKAWEVRNTLDKYIHG